MKKLFPLIFSMFTIILLITGCPHTNGTDSDAGSSTNGADSGIWDSEDRSFFWGEWTRMDNGKALVVGESKVTYAGNTYRIKSSTGSTLKVSDIGTFKRESDSVIVCNNIPYFRKGGTKLEYKLRVVGFSDTSRAADAMNVKSVRGKSQSKNYQSFISQAESDENGEMTFTAPTINDVQTVTIENNGMNVVVPDLRVQNNGDFMGTVALVEPGQYNLKITGTIDTKNKNNGYLYGNNAKSYPMTITIKNISDVLCSTSICSIEPDDPELNVSSDIALSAFVISSLEKGGTSTRTINVSYGNLDQPYIDTGLNITIENPETGLKWTDYIPLRFYKGTIPIAIGAKSPESNSDAALNGFIIYPDGNNRFFTIQGGKTEVMYVPIFGYDKKYKLVFSGATVSSKLSASTEMFYRVVVGSQYPGLPTISGPDIRESLSFGGNNHTEADAYEVSKSFEAYLSGGEIDYYSITADTDKVYSPDGTNYCKVTYVSEYDTEHTPDPTYLKTNTILNSNQLPYLRDSDYFFMGWYTDSSYSKEAEAGKFNVSGNDITLYAKWLKKCTITYVSDYGFHSPIVVKEGTALSATELPTFSKKDHIMKGWFTDNSYTNRMNPGDTISDSITLYAKWEDYDDGFAFVEGGTFTMGDSTDSGRTDDKPTHDVRVSSFYMSPYELTQNVFYEIMEANPITSSSNPISGEIQGERPCNYVSWYDAIFFCNIYSERVGLTPCYKVNGSTDVTKWEYTLQKEQSISGTITCDFSANGYRLPTEAEWEYAAKGGKNKDDYLYSGSDDIETVAWYSSNANSQTHQVGLKDANSLGLFDMSGNVYEWCWDLYGSNYYSISPSDNPTGPSESNTRVVRGGSWYNAATWSCCACRGNWNSYKMYTNAGIRLVRSSSN